MKVLETIAYKQPNGFQSTYDVIETENGKITRNKQEEIWGERYRPRIIDDLILPKKLDKTVKQAIKTQKVPNMFLFSTSGGTGKDSIVSVLSTNIPSTLLTINCSLDRSIDVIRTKVLSFVRTSSVDGTQKILYLTEIGGISNVAIDSLKGLIEDYSSMATFIVSTNSMSNISHAFKSRFQFFPMDELPKEEKQELAMRTYKRLQSIMEIEEIEYTPQDLQAHLLRWFPSHRETINLLQQNVIDGKFELTADANIESFNEIIRAINKNDFVAYTKLSKSVGIENFARAIQNRYIELVVQPNMIVNVIPALNNLQEAITKHCPFLDISLSMFCLELCNAKVQLKEIV